MEGTHTECMHSGIRTPLCYSAAHYKQLQVKVWCGMLYDHLTGSLF